MFKFSPFLTRYGIRVHDIQLNDITDESGYAEIRHAFDTLFVIIIRFDSNDRN